MKVFSSMNNILPQNILGKNMIKYFVQSSELEQWKMLEQLPLQITI